MRSIRTKKAMLSSVFFYVGVIAIVSIVVFPFGWMLFCSFKPRVELMSLPPHLLSNFTLLNYRNVFTQTPFFSRTLNSFITAISAVGIGMVVGLPAAHAIARYQYRSLAVAILMTRTIPGISFLVPWFIIYTRLGLVDTYIGLVSTHLVLTLPLIVWIMIGFFEDLSPEIEEAARMDGCNKWQAFIKITLPLCRPAIATAAILSFIFSWNHFIFALILTGSKTATLPVTVFHFITYEEIDFGGMYAGATLITFPILVLVLLIQKQFVKGLTMGGVKG
ncbi:carbohydrate ABC transporter permease [Candidatus Aerophobetes bacterium]|nr:carbohydrate ABC transporter permease [Candidatus Aerophobetes bacterium]